MIDYQALEDFVLSWLRKRLPATLYYHGIHHTFDVIEACDRIGTSEGVTDNELLLLKTAALLHDTGFTSTYKGHEEVGCDIARTYCPQYGFTKEEIEVICGMIMATQIPQTPKSHLEQIICDADLDYLGRDDFYPIARTLYEELLSTGATLTELEWDRIQISFLEKHTYFTLYGKLNRSAKKQEYIYGLKERVAQMEAKAGN